MPSLDLILQMNTFLTSDDPNLLVTEGEYSPPFQFDSEEEIIEYGEDDNAPLATEDILVGDLGEDLVDLKGVKWKTCKPKSFILLGKMRAQRRTSIAIKGKWSGERGGGYVGPSGRDDKQFKGYNLYCAILLFRVPGLPWNGWTAWPKGGVSIAMNNRENFDIDVLVLMNDNNYKDNVLHPKHPMRARIWLV
jgi:hypothetical protein